MRLTGATYAQIALAMQESPRTARRRIERVLAAAVSVADARRALVALRARA